jgi:hypothetical protein
MCVRNRILAVPCLLLLMQPAVAETPVLPDYAQFYTGNLGQIWRETTGLLELVSLCRERFPEKCAVTVNTTIPHLDRVIESTRRITVFEAFPESELTKADISSVDSIMLAGVGLRETIEKDLLEYDKDLFARYGAVVKVCPNQDVAKAGEQMTTLSAIEFYRYWQTSPDIYNAAVQAINVKADQYVREIRSGWSAEQCSKARELGRNLFAQLTTKLRPYMKDGWQSFTRNDRFGQGASFLMLTSLVFEHEVNPQIFEQLKDAAE